MATGEGPFEAILLAAGAGTRFGGAKLSRPWRGRPLLAGALEAALAAPARQVFLVTGADPAVGPQAGELARQAGASGRLRLVFAVEHARGLSASLAAGLRALPEDAAAAFVFLGDMPAVPASVAGRLAAALTAEALAAAPRFEGKRGHPVLVRRALFPDLLSLEGDQGAGRLLSGLGEKLVLVPTASPGVLFDIDVPD